jgi:hypothetical protein
MQVRIPKGGSIAIIITLVILTVFFQTATGWGAPRVSTDKDVYNHGEVIRVNFFDSPGNASDWICIVAAGSPADAAGDYKYIPTRLSQGVLIFAPPSPGKYEARAYYNYRRNGYVVSARYAFSVAPGPGQGESAAQRMERKIDPNNPLEANLLPGEGMVYIFRESFFLSSSFEVPIKADGKPIVVMQNASYFVFKAPAGDVLFTTGYVRNAHQDNEEVEPIREGKVTLRVKPGYVYYLRLRLIPVPFWGIFLDHVPHQEGENLINNYDLNLITTPSTNYIKV